MSVGVDLDELQHEIGRFGPAAFLLSVRDDLRPHVVSVAPSWDGDALVVAIGRRSAANAADRPAVALLWPGPDAEGFGLIVDGEAAIEGAADDEGGAVLRVRPRKAVLHRARAAVEPGAAGSDCRPVLPDRRNG
jgi:hypothetical protein